MKLQLAKIGGFLLRQCIWYRKAPTNRGKFLLFKTRPRNKRLLWKIRM